MRKEKKERKESIMTNEQLIEVLDRLKTGLISVATSGSFPDDEYTQARRILMNSPQLSNNVPLFIKSNRSPLEFRRWMQGKYEDYANRRKFITEEINKLILYLENNPGTITYEKTGWEKIDESVGILLGDLNNITDRLSINEIGVRCRETIILLSNEVYKEELHHPSDYPDSISPTDAKRKFDGYFEYQFSGKDNDEKRNYAKACNKLANYLTHSSHVTETDARLCISATLSLIQLIKVINDKQ